MNGNVEIALNNEIAEITFNHPKGNSLPSNLLNELKVAIETCDQNVNVKIIVLKSLGEKVFCSGASFDELLEIRDTDQAKNFFSGFAYLINTMRKCSKLIIGLAKGKSVGGGVGLLSACDYVIATESASIKLSELSIGFGPFVIAPAVERKIGVSGLANMTLNPKEWFSASWALQKGLYHKVCDEFYFDDNANQFLESLSSSSLEAMQGIKSILWEGTDHWDVLLYERAKMSGDLILSDFTKNTLKEFKAK